MTELAVESRSAQPAGLSQETLPPRSKPGGLTASCGCRFTRLGGEWVHVCPCRGHRLSPGALSDSEMKFLTTEDGE